MKEEDLFLPIKNLFVDLGYTVNAEVRNCDVTAIKDDNLIIIELKKTLSVKLLAQGVNRQKAGANVFVAIPKPKAYQYKSWRDILYVLKKLELGLIFVTISDKFTFAEIVQEPQPFLKTHLYKPKKLAILTELNSRHCDTNIGGATKKKIVTAYTEKAIHIACLLQLYGELSPKALRDLGSDVKSTQSILNSNFYGWFDKVDKGIYALSDKGKSFRLEYPEVYEYYNKICKKDDC